MTDRYAHIAREFLSIHKVYRYHLKKIDDMDDSEVMNVCHWWYTENHMEKEYRKFENQKLGIAFDNLPAHKSDLIAVEHLKMEPSERVIPLLPELMEWLKDMNWPVAQAILPLMVKYEDETTRIAGEILKPDQEDDIWKYWIITQFVPALSNRNQHILMNEIRRIAYHPTNGEQTEEVDEVAREYLKQG